MNLIHLNKKPGAKLKFNKNGHTTKKNPAGGAQNPGWGRAAGPRAQILVRLYC